jgi:dolichol kinase
VSGRHDRAGGGPPSPEEAQAHHWFTEAQRKSIHLAFIVLPLEILHQWLLWPRGRAQWRWMLLTLVAGAIAIDLLRIHEHRVRRLFRDIFGGMIRERERFTLLGSTYLLMAALLAVEIFPRPIAAAALGFTVLGDGVAALAGKAWGRTRFFNKTLEGSAAGLAACLAWGAWLAMSGHLAWPTVLAGALAAMVVELLPIPLDDNLGMTLASGYVMRLVGGPR